MYMIKDLETPIIQYMKRKASPFHPDNKALIDKAEKLSYSYYLHICIIVLKLATYLLCRTFFILDTMLSKSKLFIFFLIGVISASCSIDEKFKFNSDLSGHYSFEFDYSAILEFDSSGSANMEMDKGYIEMEEELKGIQLFSDKNWKSDFVTGYLIKGIPRFILIDPNGNIVNSNAPRPSSEKLIKLFNENNI